MEEKKQSSNKTLVIIIIILLLLLIGGAGGFFAWYKANHSEGGGESEATSKKEIPFAVNVGVLEEGTDFNAAIREDVDKMIPITYSPYAISTDGENFQCKLGNSKGAVYAMYFDLYTDLTFSEHIYLSGLVPPGMQLESFKSDIKFPKGQRDIIMVVTTVGDDRDTLIAQQNIVITLIVGDEE